MLQPLRNRANLDSVPIGHRLSCLGDSLFVHSTVAIARCCCSGDGFPRKSARHRSGLFITAMAPNQVAISCSARLALASCCSI